MTDSTSREPAVTTAEERRHRARAARQSTADKLATIAGELEDLAVELHHAFPICSSRCDWAAEHLRNAVSDLLGPAKGLP